MLFKKSVQGSEFKSELNLTPLVDVMLVLLIIFIITAPMIRPQQLNVNLPKTSTISKKETPGKTLELSLNAQGKIALDGRVVTDAELSTELVHAAQQEGTRVHLLIDQSLSYGRVAELMAMLQKNGLTRLSFLTLAQ
jgi:biopolymer transport protein ExbD